MSRIKLTLSIEVDLTIDRGAIDTAGDLFDGADPLAEPKSVIVAALLNAAEAMPDWAVLAPNHGGLGGWEGQVELAVIQATAPERPIELDSEDDTTLSERLRSEQRWQELVELLIAQLPQLDDTDQLVAHLAEAAQISNDMLGEPQQAAELWRQLLEVEPGHQQAIEGLTMFYQMESRWQELVSLLDLRIGAVESDSERIELLREKAWIVEENLEDKQLLRQTLEAILTIDPEDELATESLALLE